MRTPLYLALDSDISLTITTYLPHYEVDHYKLKKSHRLSIKIQSLPNLVA